MTVTDTDQVTTAPRRPSKRIVKLAWWVFATQVLIVATGGAVRLTGSGLGCSTWPHCSPESFVYNPAMGYHSLIEYGNRLLFILLEVVAILAVIAVWKIRKERRDLFWLALIPALTVFVQALIGAVVVWSGLNPYIVGLHFLASVILVALAGLFVRRAYMPTGLRGTRRVSVPLRQITWIAVLFGTLTIIMGILTTGAGPHAGDGGAARNNLDIASLFALHAAPAYLTLAFTAAVYFMARWEGPPAHGVQRWAGWAIVVMILQIIVGVWQARTALPPVLVGIHMVLACLLAAALLLMIVETRQRVSPRITEHNAG